MHTYCASRIESANKAKHRAVLINVHLESLPNPRKNLLLRMTYMRQKLAFSAVPNGARCVETFEGCQQLRFIPRSQLSSSQSNFFQRALVLY